MKSVVGPVGEECPYKRNRRDRSGDRKHRGGGDHHGERHRGDHRGDGHRGDHHRGEHRGEHHFRRPRTSWLETFATYMNEFANLAGDVDVTIPDDRKQGQTQNNEATHSNAPGSNPTETGEQTAAQENAPPQTETHGNAQSSAGTQSAQCPFSSANITVDKIQKLIQMYLDRRLNLDTVVPPAAPTPAASDVEMSQGEQTAPEANVNSAAGVQVSATTQASATAQAFATAQSSTSAQASATVPASTTTDEANRDVSPDKTDGWTMISKEKGNV